MKVIHTPLPGVRILEPRAFRDERGVFLESYNQKVLAEHGVTACFKQDNHVRSIGRGILRGLHFQRPPAAQAKLVRVTRGRVVDVVVDLRRGSPTYGQSTLVELSEDNLRELYIPAGLAHAYQCLDEITEFQYKVDAYYSPILEGGIRWDDPDLAIDWPIKTPVLSAKDEALPLFRDLDSPFVFDTA